MAHKASELDTMDEFRRETLLLLQKALKAEKGNFFLVKNTGAFLDLHWVVTGGIEEKDLRLHRRYYNHLDRSLHPAYHNEDALMILDSLKPSEKDTQEGSRPPRRFYYDRIS